MSINVKMPVDQISIDPRLQIRAAISVQVAGDYAESMRNDVSMPPVAVFFDGQTHWLADGFHRIKAAAMAGIAEISADVRDGSFRDALRHALGANADKRRAVEAALADPEWGALSNRKIAGLCRVSHAFVNIIRSESGNVSTSTTGAGASEPSKTPYRNRYGRIVGMNPTNIGKGRRKAPAPPPAPPAMELPDLHEPPRPCPFCLKTDTRLGFDDGTGTHRVFCVACTAIGPGGNTEERAVFEWNCRQ